MKLRDRELQRGDTLTKDEYEQMLIMCSRILETILNHKEVMFAYYTTSLSSEAVYFMIKVRDGGRLRFSVRNHVLGEAHKRQKNFCLWTFRTQLKMKNYIMGWLNWNIAYKQEKFRKQNEEASSRIK